MTDDRLNLADLARELAPLEMTASTIQRYDANPDVQRLLDKQNGTYPATSLSSWRKIAEARKQKPPMVRPETAGLFLEGVLHNPEQPIIADRLPMRQGQEILTQLPAELLERYVSVLERQVEAFSAIERHTEALRALPDPDDALLTMKQAAAQYGVPMGVLKGMRVNVGTGNTKRVKRSTVLAYIRNLPDPR